MDVFEEEIKMKADVHTLIDTQSFLIYFALYCFCYDKNISNYALVLCLLFSKDKDYKLISHSRS